MYINNEKCRNCRDTPGGNSRFSRRGWPNYRVYRICAATPINVRSTVARDCVCSYYFIAPLILLSGFVAALLSSPARQRRVITFACHARENTRDTERYIRVDCFVKSGNKCKREGTRVAPLRRRRRDDVIKFLVAVDNFPRDYFSARRARRSPYHEIPSNLFYSFFPFPRTGITLTA